jgi:dinuclear metal center YbgI/SA1388 family protein
VAVALDATASALAFARSHDASLLIAHHPLIYHPLPTLAGDSAQVQAIRMAIENSIAVASAHTNWDAAIGGVNDALARKLGLSSVAAFGDDVRMDGFKLVTFVPEANMSSVLDALASAGCGEIGLYTRCAFFSRGTGTYIPSDGARPAIGEVAAVNETDEIRLEVVLPADRRGAAVAALRAAHPYEEPAFDLYPLDSWRASLPRKGVLESPVSFEDFERHVAAALGTATRAFGKRERRVSTVGVVGGAGGKYWLKARVAGCDALVTGEVPHHEAVAAAESGFCLIEAGHYATEQPGVEALAARLSTYVPTLVFEPQSGASGRPG